MANELTQNNHNSFFKSPAVKKQKEEITWLIYTS